MPYNQTVLPILELIRSEINKVLAQNAPRLNNAQSLYFNEPDIKLFYNSPYSDTILTNVEMLYADLGYRILVDLTYGDGNSDAKNFEFQLVTSRGGNRKFVGNVMFASVGPDDASVAYEQTVAEMMGLDPYAIGSSVTFTVYSLDPSVRVYLSSYGVTNPSTTSSNPFDFVWAYYSPTTFNPYGIIRQHLTSVKTNVMLNDETVLLFVINLEYDNTWKLLATHVDYNPDVTQTF